jgi:hypothetical protein
MFDADRVRTDHGDASPSFPGTHAIPNRVNAAQACRTAPAPQRVSLRCLAKPALRNLQCLRNSAMKQN